MHALLDPRHIEVSPEAIQTSHQVPRLQVYPEVSLQDPNFQCPFFRCVFHDLKWFGSRRPDSKGESQWPLAYDERVK